MYHVTLVDRDAAHSFARVRDACVHIPRVRVRISGSKHVRVVSKLVRENGRDAKIGRAHMHGHATYRQLADNECLTE